MASLGTRAQETPVATEHLQVETRTPGFFEKHKTGIIVSCVIIGVVVVCQMIGSKCKEKKDTGGMCKVANAINSVVDAIAAPFVWVFNHFLLLMCLGLLALGLPSVAKLFGSLSSGVREYVESDIAERSGEADVGQQKGSDDPWLIDKDGKVMRDSEGNPMRPTEGKVALAQQIKEETLEQNVLTDYAPLDPAKGANGQPLNEDVEPEAEAEGLAIDITPGSASKPETMMILGE